MNELDMLRASRPEVAAPRREVLDTALAQVLDEVPPRGATPATRRSLPGRRIMLASTLVTGGLAAAIAVVVAAGIGLIPAGTGDDGTPATAAVMLRAAAETTRAAPEIAPKPSQWVYVESKARGIPGLGVFWAPGEDADTARPTTSFHVRSWYPAIGAEVLGCSPHPGTPPGSCAAQVSEMIRQVNGREERFALLPDSYGWDPEDQAFVRSLPTRPDALLKRIYARADIFSHWKNFDRDQKAVENIADLMDGHIPRALRAALFEVLSRIPGVRLDRDAVDNVGRHGIGISRTGGDVTIQIIVERETYRYLGDRLTAVRQLDGGVKAGTDLRWSAQLQVSVVDRPRQLPH